MEIRLPGVYRHFPIPNLHPNAPKLAEVSECVTQVDGEDGFWSFSDKYFEVKGKAHKSLYNR